ncbi:MAG TPA: hypothetical protein VJT72_18300 [Pseudonocardiaceae bacterium]|nr:hypothetical protein [Pseudonocardiaceae bacterium]
MTTSEAGTTIHCVVLRGDTEQPGLPKSWRPTSRNRSVTALPVVV